MNGWEQFCYDLECFKEDLIGTRDDPRTANTGSKDSNFWKEQGGNITAGGVTAAEKYAAANADKAAKYIGKEAAKKVGKTASSGTAGKALGLIDAFNRATNGHENNHKHEFLKKLGSFVDYFVAGGETIGADVPGSDLVMIPASFIVDGFNGEGCTSKMNGKTNNLLDVLDFFTIQMDGALTQLFGGNTYNWRKDMGFGDTDNLYAPRTAIKPNIYLYPEEETTVTVEFTDPELLLTVIPDYPGNWTVDATPDGWLSLEGETYGFLFYESMTSCNFMQTEEAWIVPEFDREGFFTEICEGYGFNGRETEDFVTFWCSRLPEGRSYVMYPELTGIIDREMPVHVSPEPDSIFRLWFLYVPVEEFSASELSGIRTPKYKETARREGFSLVEWGGIVAE